MPENDNGKKKILVFIDWFWPGYKAGGPISAAVNLVHHLHQDYTLYIFTTDRDLNAQQPYEGIAVNQWVPYHEANVYYNTPDNLTYKKIQAVIAGVGPHYIYLNSQFSKYFALYPLLIRKYSNLHATVVLAPRGMLKDTALAFKSFKKKLYLQAFKLLGLHKGIRFHATDATEVNDIRKHFGAHMPVTLAPDFPEFVKDYTAPTEKKKGEMRIIFVGRLHPIKQLDWLLQQLPGLTASVLLTIVGDEEDKQYTDRCKQLSQTLPANIRVMFRGGIPNKELPAVFAQHHIFALPTRGENFGHAIFEAMANGKPVLISDQTPWRHLPVRHAGWDVSLAVPDAFKEVLVKVAEMDQQAYNQWSEGAWQFAKQFSQEAGISTAYKNLFS